MLPSGVSADVSVRSMLAVVLILLLGHVVVVVVVAVGMAIRTTVMLLRVTVILPAALGPFHRLRKHLEKAKEYKEHVEGLFQ